MTTALRLVIGLAGLVALLVVNFFAVAFVTGYATALGGYSTAGVLAVIAGFVFIAPFNYALFQRAMDYVVDGGGAAE